MLLRCLFPPTLLLMRQQCCQMIFFSWFFLRYAKMISWKFNVRIYETIPEMPDTSFKSIVIKYMRKTCKYVNFVRLSFFINSECRRGNNFSWKSTYKYRGTLHTLEALNSTSWKLEFFISLGKADITLYLLYICHQIYTHFKFT